MTRFLRRFLTISAATAAILWSTNSPSKADLIVCNYSGIAANVAS